MLAPPPPQRWKLFFMGFLPRSFRRSTSLSDPPLDSPVVLFCLFFPRPILFAPSLASLLLSFSPLASSVRCPLVQTHEREEGMWWNRREEKTSASVSLVLENT